MAGQGELYLTVVDLPELTTGRLNELLRGSGQDGKASGWLNAYPASYLPYDERFKREWEWPTALDRFIPELWVLVADKLDLALKERGVKPGAGLVWLPSGALGILPLGLAQDPGSKRHFAETYEIVYVPSIEALAAASAHVAKPHPPSLAAAINPTGDLTFTDGCFRLSVATSEIGTFLPFS